MRYVFRLSETLKEKLDLAAPPKAHRGSAFIREAIVAFLCKPKQTLGDRIHVRGQPNAYRSVCAILTPELLQAIKAAYPDESVSVVIQAAVTAELKKARHKIAHDNSAENPKSK